MSIQKWKKALETHRAIVREAIYNITEVLYERSMIHDQSKYSPEEPAFQSDDIVELEELEYNSEEYNTRLDVMKDSLKHHYNVNRHHPEHFATRLNEMDLVDVIEMLADWKANSLTAKDGDLVEMIKTNKFRYRYNNHMVHILTNTAKRYLYQYVVVYHHMKCEPDIICYGDTVEALEKCMKKEGVYLTDEAKYIRSKINKNNAHQTPVSIGFRPLIADKEIMLYKGIAPITLTYELYLNTQFLDILHTEPTE